MIPPRNNLLLRLHKWAWRQDENFLTEAFAHLLQHLLDQEPEAAVRILRAVTNDFLTLAPADAGTLELKTQVVSSAGRPDLELRTTRQLAYVEVKSESPVDRTQLEAYRRLLQESSIPSTTMILLTRYPVRLGEAEQQWVRLIRWFQVADVIEQERSRYKLKAESAFLVEQFLDFLGARNMTIGQVTWELPGGIRAVRALTDMLTEVASACGCQAQYRGSKGYTGVHLDKPKYILGIYDDHPEVLWFETNYCKIDKEAAERLGIEGVYEWSQGPGHGWRRPLSFESEEVHFFARSKVSQMQLLESFLRECLDTVNKIELPGGEQAPAAAEEPEPAHEPPAPPGL